MMSGLEGSSAKSAISFASYGTRKPVAGTPNIPETGAGPRTFVLIGRMATFPMVLTEGSSM